MRISRATFIPGPRTIFSLEALAKIVEGVLTVEFTNCTNEDYAINGDPGVLRIGKSGVSHHAWVSHSQRSNAHPERMV